MTLPYREPLTVREAPPRTIPEPPRKGEPGGEPCRICSGGVLPAVWSDDLWTLHPPSACSLPGTVWLASREHADSFTGDPVPGRLGPRSWSSGRLVEVRGRRAGAVRPLGPCGRLRRSGHQLLMVTLRRRQSAGGRCPCSCQS